MDRTLVVWRYFDGPRTGFVEYAGTPYYFSCEWDPDADDFAGDFDLFDIDETARSAAVESWEIVRAWEDDFHAGRVAPDEHPSLGGKHARYDALSRLLESAVAQSSPAAVRGRPVFVVDPDASLPPPGILRALRVAWSNAA